MSNLNKKIQDAYIRLKNEAVYGIYGNRYIPQNKDGEFDNQINFPNIEDPTNYVTHVSVEEEISEAPNPEENAKKDKPLDFEELQSAVGDEGDETGEEVAPPEEGMDPNTQPGGMPGEDPSMMGGTPEAQALTQNQLGRMYELKKIYSRLSSVESFLSRTTDDNILEIRKMVSNAIDLFELVISNFEQYKENVDEIIITYYKFLDVVYDSIRTHFKQISKQ